MPKREVVIPPGFKELLQDFTVCVLRDNPEDIIQFGIDYFKTKKSEQLQSAHLDSESENDDQMEEMAPMPRPQGRRRGVAAESFDPEKEDDPNQERIVYPKTPEQRARLNLAVQNILLFRCLDEEQMVDVIDAMFERRVALSEKVIVQGEDGDNFYVIESGLYDIIVKINGVDTKVGKYDGSGSFGELALMYNTPRAATIQAVTEGVVWAMTRETFRSIVLKKAFQKRLKYEALLEHVPLLKELSPYERMNIADALLTKICEPSTTVIKQGEPGLEMYFIEEGSVRVTVKEAGSDNEAEVTRIGPGGYFGELALLTKHPRAASVYCLEKTKLAVLDVGSFERLLGPCLDIMQRSISNYEEQLKGIFGTLQKMPELRR